MLIITKILEATYIHMHILIMQYPKLSKRITVTYSIMGKVSSIIFHKKGSQRRAILHDIFYIQFSNEKI